MVMRVASPQRGEPPLLIPQAKYFTMRVPVAPADTAVRPIRQRAATSRIFAVEGVQSAPSER